MKKFLGLTLLAVAMLGISTASAQKMARINMQEIVVAMPEFTQAQKNLELFGQELQHQMEELQVEFNKKLAEYEKGQATMVASVKQMKQQELQQLQQRFAEFQQFAQQDFQKKEAELLEPVQQKAQDAINKIAKANGFTVVFNTAVPSLIYFDESHLVDIAPLVKKELGIVEKPAK